MLSGENSILQRATDTKTKSDEAQIRERIQLAYHSALTSGKGSYTKDSLEEELKNEFGDGYEVDDSDNDNWILKAKGQRVTIPAGKKVEFFAKDKLTVTVNDDGSVESKSYVNYPAKDGNTENKILCRILYNDNVNGLQLVAVNPTKTVKLGTTDENGSMSSF